MTTSDTLVHAHRATPATSTGVQRLQDTLSSAEWFDLLDDLDAFVGTHEVCGRDLQLERRADGWLQWTGGPTYLMPPLTVVLGAPGQRMSHRLNPAHGSRPTSIDEFMLARRIRWLDSGAMDRAVPESDHDFLAALMVRGTTHRPRTRGSVTSQAIARARGKQFATLRRPRGHRTGIHVLVGIVEESWLIVMDVDLAFDLAQFWHAFRTAKTWGEFKALAPARHYADALERAESMGLFASDDDECDDVCDDDEEYGDADDAADATDEPWAQHRSAPPKRDARAALPYPDTPFDGDSIFPVSDGTYPEWPEAEMLRLIPDEILERHACVQSSTHDGEFATIEPESLEALVADLEAAGFVCHRNDEVVTAAKGC